MFLILHDDINKKQKVGIKYNEKNVRKCLKKLNSIRTRIGNAFYFSILKKHFNLTCMYRIKCIYNSTGIHQKVKTKNLPLSVDL